jgi:hypothetical protein
MSIVQLRYAAFRNCTFGNTGYTGRYGSHAPAAGVDIEPDYRHDDPSGQAKGDHSTGDIAFVDCTFVDNRGFQLVASSLESTQHPVRLTRCRFVNRRRSETAVVPAIAQAIFRDCEFDEVGLWPSYTFDSGATSTQVIRCRFASSQPGHSVLLMSADAPTVNIQASAFELKAPRPHTWYRILLAGRGLSFVDNEVSIAPSEAAPQERPDIVAILHNARLVANSRWSVDARADRRRSRRGSWRYLA